MMAILKRHGCDLGDVDRKERRGYPEGVLEWRPLMSCKAKANTYKYLPNKRQVEERFWPQKAPDVDAIKVLAHWRDWGSQYVDVWITLTRDPDEQTTKYPRNGFNYHTINRWVRSYPYDLIIDCSEIQTRGDEIAEEAIWLNTKTTGVAINSVRTRAQEKRRARQRKADG